MIRIHEQRENSRGQKLVKLSAPENTMRWRFACDRNKNIAKTAEKDPVTGETITYMDAETGEPAE